MSKEQRFWNLPTEESMQKLAVKFALCLQAPLIIYLKGELGTGKTTFARALIQGLGYAGRVKSPTYGLLESYQAGGFDFLHLDLYRIQSPAELEYLAIADQFSRKGILLIEWPEKALTALPPADICLNFKENRGGRSLQFEALSQSGREIIEKLKSEI